jgi:hypothetical protein
MICRSIRMSILLAAMMVTLGPPKAQAQITAPGPYYAVPSWDQTLPTATRFIILSNMNGEAVLDRETGLVWERAPSSPLAVWEDARGQCFEKHVGGRRGWRLAAIHELMTLMDIPNLPTFGTVAALPSGHPFDLSGLSGQSQQLWSSTRSADSPTLAYTLHLSGKAIPVGSGIPLDSWCVRGHEGQ